MAYSTTKSPGSFNLMRMIHAALATIGYAMMRPMDAKAEHSRRQINALHALSDEELARRGIRRDDIEHLVITENSYI